LNEQNAELMQKLERLESESASAELSGRRILRKLEKDIELLRDELERTQARNSELEEQAKHNFGLDPQRVAEEVLKKKYERELHIQALKNSSNSSSTSESHVLDFAPTAGRSSTSSRSMDLLFPSLASSQGPPDEHSLLESHHPGQLNALPSMVSPVTEMEWAPRRRHSDKSESPPPEPQLAIISQLLMKMQELEDTNASIVEQQWETSKKLQAIQRETENMAKVYEYLSDNNNDIKLELVEDSILDDEDELRNYNDETIRFRSLRRTIENRNSSIVSPAAVDSYNLSGARKERKSVFGLFGTQALSSNEPQDVNSHKTFTFPTVGDGDSEFDYHNLPYSPSPLRAHSGGSLGSELGSEYGEESRLNAFNHHLRTSSLYNLSSIRSRRTSLISSVNSDVRDELDESMVGTPSTNEVQLTVEPPTPAQLHKSSNMGPAKTTAAETRLQNLSQTIRSRTSKWIDARFTDRILGPLRTQVGSETMTIPSTDTKPADVAAPHSSATALIPSTSSKAVVKERHSLVKFMIEVWLWFQFAIIILVFVIAMARRGPRSIIAETRKGTPAS
jgi:hypothetical protein